MTSKYVVSKEDRRNKIKEIMKERGWKPGEVVETSELAFVSYNRIVDLEVRIEYLSNVIDQLTERLALAERRCPG